jgi:hypothetical protein
MKSAIDLLLAEYPKQIGYWYGEHPHDEKKPMGLVILFPEGTELPTEERTMMIQGEEKPVYFSIAPKRQGGVILGKLLPMDVGPGVWEDFIVLREQYRVKAGKVDKEMLHKLNQLARIVDEPLFT